MAASLAGVTPVPTDEEAAVIVAALELLTPRPVAAEAEDSSSDWRFSARHWVRPTGWPRRNY